MNCTVFLPSIIASSDEARRLLQQACALSLTPVEPPHKADGFKKFSFYVPPILSAALKRYHDSLSGSDLICGLILAALGNGQSASASLVNVSRKWNQTRCQKDMVDIMLKGISNKMIVLMEGSTGIGKSRVIATTVLRLAGKKIGIFAPTLAILYQLFEEFLHTAGKDHPPIAIYIGRRNFVDGAKLEDILAVLEIRDSAVFARAKQWIKKGGPAITAISKKLSKHTPLHWLVDDLVEIIPDVSASSVGCDELSKACPGMDAYQEAKAALDDAQVVFSTHTMLCLSALSTGSQRNALLPDFEAVFIDEAHQLEEAMANITGSDLSLRHLQASLRDGYERKDVSSNRWKSIDSLIADCQNQLDLLPNDYYVPARVQGAPPYQTFRRHAEELAKKLKEIKASKDSAWLERIKRWRYALGQICSYKCDARVTFSPKLRLASVTVGPSYLRHYFDALWESCESACLLSATLYTCEKPGQFSSRYLRLKLCIPSDRALDTKPFIAPWIFDTPTVHTVAAASAEAFAYPGGEAPAELEKWFDTIAHSLSIIANDAAGGTLVLCNSYADTEALGCRLDSIIRHLIVQTRHNSVKTLTSVFKATARAGKRPVWIATGPAWTGLNLRDELAGNAADDRILSDLVIARSPMGRNRTAAHMSRVSTLGFEQELLDAAFTLRQGLGRLIRREGLKERRIWFLDGRIHTKRATFYKVSSLIRTYPRQATITA